MSRFRCVANQFHGYTLGQVLLLCWGILVLGLSTAQAQSDNRRCQTIPVPYEGQLDSLLIDPASFYVLAAHAPDTLPLAQFDWKYRWDSSIFSLKNLSNELLMDSVRLCYRVWPAAMNQILQERLRPVDDTAQYLERLVFQDFTEVEEASFISLQGLGGEQLQSSGQLARGVSLGTGASQDVAINSSLNLQLDGPIAPGLQLTATISDQQVPFQPEGNTQQLQDFDRILLQLKHDKGLLKAGDIQLQQDSSAYFMQFYKNVQGAQANAYWKDTLGRRQETQLGFSSAKGQFHSQQVQPREGVQGPYRLRGANQERFIIVMAGSEKVYVDGQLQERGYDAHYTIDYNQAEVTFTNRVLITQFTRVRIDFEYAVQQYARNIVQGLHTEKGEKYDFRLRLYREKDNPNSPLLNTLESQEREALRSAGDSLSLAVIPSFSLTEYTANQVLYELIDTIDAGLTYRVFRRSTNALAAVYQVGFSEVGFGNGDYVQANATANGRVYSWVAPIEGISQGNYAPIRQLAAPNQKQLWELSGNYQLSKQAGLYGNFALSDHDANLLSEKGNADNQGMAARLGYQWAKKGLGKKEESSIRVFADAEWDSEYFRSIDRFRSIEFDRNWSTGAEGNAVEQIYQAGFAWNKGTHQQLDYRLVRRNREGDTKGWQHWLSFGKRFGDWKLDGNGFLLQTQLQDSLVATRQSDWLRGDVGLTRKGKYVEGGYRFGLDQNAISQLSNDSITESAMYFKEHQFFLQTGDSLRWSARLDYRYRTDYNPLAGSMAIFSKSQTANLALKRQVPDNRLEFLLTYRLLDYAQINAETSQTIMARLDWDRDLWKRSVRYSFSFSTSSGQELRREFVFLPVDVGQGTHHWRDDNEDGIQDLNEFYPAVFADERRYAKFFVPTDDYVQAFTTLLNMRLQLTAPVAWRKAEGWRKWLSRWSGQGQTAITKRTTSDALQERLWVGGSETDASLLSYRNQSRWALFYNRTDPKYGWEYQGSYVDGKQLLTAGFQRNVLLDQNMTVRVAIQQQWVIRLSGGWGRRDLSSDALSSQNYQINQKLLGPSLEYQPSTQWRWNLFGNLKWKEGQPADTLISQATLWELGLQLRRASKEKGALTAQIKTNIIQFDGQANTPLGYDLLEALSVGQNWLWEASWNYRLAKGLQLNVRYSGRKPAGSLIVHLGSVQLAAAF